MNDLTVLPERLPTALTAAPDLGLATTTTARNVADPVVATAEFRMMFDAKHQPDLDSWWSREY